MTRLIHYFNDCRIDLSARELRRDGELIQVSPRIFDCIGYLIEQRERAVGRDELMAAVWGKVDVADTQLAQAILKARRAVGDTGEEQHTIRTVPRFGYRWVADVSVADVGATANDAAALPGAARTEKTPPAPGNGQATPEMAAAERPGRIPDVADRSGVVTRGDRVADNEKPAKAGAHARASRRDWTTVAITAVVLAVAVVVTWALRDGLGRIGAESEARSLAPESQPAVDAVAVLPVSIDADAEWAWLRLGLMEYLASRLRDAGQKTLPSDNVVAVVRAEMTATQMIDAIRDALNPQWTIQPSARKTDSGWTVSLVLEDQQGTHREVEAQAEDAITAARRSADRVLTLLGKPIVQADEGSVQWPNDELLSRIDAALLVDDVEAAGALIASAPRALREQPPLHLRQAQLDFAAGRFEQAKTRFDGLLDDAAAMADPVLHARAANGRGAAHIRLGKAARAERDFTRALAAIERLGHPAITGHSMTGRAVARALLGRYDDAITDFSQARIAMQLAGDTLGLARVEMNEGALNGVRNHPAAALTSFQVAERYFERFGAYDELMHARGNQIVAYGALLRPLDALNVSESSADLADRLVNSSAEQLWTYRRAQALAGVGRWREARALLESLLRPTGPAQDADVAAMGAATLADIELTLSRPDSALALTAGPIDRLTDAEAPTRSVLWLSRVRALLHLRRNDEAVRESARFADWALGTGNEAIALRSGLAEAECLARAGQVASAIERFEALLRSANDVGVPADIAAVAIAYGEMLIHGQELDRAAPVVGQVARFAQRDYGSALLQLRLYHALGQQEAWRSALRNVHHLAGERPIPDALTRFTIDAGAAAGQPP